jgi:hypothetical protein
MPYKQQVNIKTISVQAHQRWGGFFLCLILTGSVFGVCEIDGFCLVLWNVLNNLSRLTLKAFYIVIL